MVEVGRDGDPMIFEDFQEFIESYFKELSVRGLISQDTWTILKQRNSTLTNLLEFSEDITAMIDKENSNLIRFSEDNQHCSTSKITG